MLQTLAFEPISILGHNFTDLAVSMLFSSTLGRVENQKFLNFNPGHVDSVVIHKNNEENAKKSSFRLKTYC